MRHVPLLVLLAACAAPAEDDTDDTDDTDVAETDDTDPVETDTDETDVVDTEPAEPEPMDVTITPAAPVAGDALTCTPGEAGTAFFRWEKNGVEANVTAAVVPEGTVDAYQRWTCFAATADGAYAGSAEVEIGEACAAFTADAADDVLVVAPDNALNRVRRDFTVELWALWPAAPAADAEIVIHQGLLSATPQRTDYALRLTADGQLLFLTGGAADGCADLAVAAPEAGSWHHLAGTWNSATGEKRLWVDGQPAASCDNDARPTSDVLGALYLGAALESEGLPEGRFIRPFVGTVDEVRLSRTVRYLTSFGPSLYHAPDADTIFLLHLNEVGTFGPPQETFTGSPDASGNELHARLGAGVVELDVATSICDLR